MHLRAGGRCEYCGVPQSLYPDFRFHVEHVVARKHGGGDGEENLALACHLCNLSKGSNLSGIDPDSGALTRLFHPRTDVWDDHFLLEDSGRVDGKTAVGRTTVAVLAMNQAIRMKIRRQAPPSP